MRNPSESRFRSRRGWASIFGFMLVAFVAGLAISLSKREPLALIIGSVLAVPTAFMAYRARGLINSRQAARELHDKRVFFQTVLIGVVVAIILEVLPPDWFAALGLPAAGGGFGASLKLLLVGTKVESEFPESE